MLGITTSAVGFIPGKAPVIADTAMKILGMALSAEPRFSLAEYAYPIKGPVYLDQKTTIKKYERLNDGYVSSQKVIGKPDTVNRDILKELEDWGLIIK